ncbi:aa3-type cytochrome c oxidase subunit IV [Pontibaca salina]|uniref:Aa3-type cytochrome c oxidase subunit IV n=1 Tax=Pontibaca salina TaxID=2795731 RepID=A0A934HLW7_9RHOB|nr:aa3-type cytochrome c oxidase subunit IV [Pontibaca salina]MBI6629311.1 aa3-type cytochrome c oxidase subunit IV [Pontibaca salina]
MAEQHGDMDIAEQDRTYAGFLSLIVKVVIASVVLAIFLAIFAT